MYIKYMHGVQGLKVRFLYHAIANSDVGPTYLTSESPVSLTSDTGHSAKEQPPTVLYVSGVTQRLGENRTWVPWLRSESPNY